MSIIAKSLKRLKENKKPNFNISGSKKKIIGISIAPLFYYIAIIFVFIVAIFIYAYTSFYNANKKINNMKFPSITKLQSRFDHEKKLATNIKKQRKGLDELFILKKFDKMFEIAKKRNDLKYEGLYYFKKGNLDMAYKLFQDYIKKHKNDNSVKAYMAFVLYRQKRYSEAIKMLDAIKIKSCELIVDMAVVYESFDNYKEALGLYRQAYAQCKNPITASRIRKKIIVLEYYLRNIDES